MNDSIPLIPVPTSTPNNPLSTLSPNYQIDSPLPSPFPWRTTAESIYPDEAGRADQDGNGSTPGGFEFIDWGYRNFNDRGRDFEWKLENQTFVRRLGPTEASYYLGSRGDNFLSSGVNDMYLNIQFTASTALMLEERLQSIWLELVTRHPLLSATIRFESFEEIYFCYDLLDSDEARKSRATKSFELQTGAKDEIIDSYLNGQRSLSDSILAKLIISTPALSSTPSSSAKESQEFNFHFCTTHFLGDGMALHSTANEFFLLLSEPSPTNPHSIEAILVARKSTILEPVVGVEKLLPLKMESKLTAPAWSKLGWAGAKVDFQNDQSKLIGGQTFPRAKLGIRKTLIATNTYSSEITSTILKNCKDHKLTIAHCLFALSNLAFIKGKKEIDQTLPTMLYSALNIRPFLDQDDEDWFHIAIGYYNIILPSTIPSTISSTQLFWHRSQSVKTQTTKAVKSKFIKSRAKLMALERESRSIGFEKADELKRNQVRELESGLNGLGIKMNMEDGKAEKNGVSVCIQAVKSRESSFEPEEEKSFVQEKKVASTTPTLALMGLSMLGNLDGIYRHSLFHSITLTDLTTGSRQRPGSSLLFAYTFSGKLFLSLGYDVNGFERNTMESFFQELQNGVEEHLMKF